MVKKIVKTKEIKKAYMDKALFDSTIEILDNLYMDENFTQLHKSILEYTKDELPIKMIPTILMKKPNDNLEGWFVYACDYLLFINDHYNTINVPQRNGVLKILDIPPTIRAICDFLAGFSAGG